ncbi:MAG: hypothetical protein HGA54_06290, partial [Actinobacteria bacterium]|nr:hypothetical protein [Actinomycetota bacterium]
DLFQVSTSVLMSGGGPEAEQGGAHAGHSCFIKLLRQGARVHVAVFGYPHPRLVEIVMAVIQAKEGEIITDEEIIEFCKGRGLAKYKWPEKMVYAVIPRNPAGKIEKPKLREKYCGGRLVEQQIKD